MKLCAAVAGQVGTSAHARNRADLSYLGGKRKNKLSSHMESSWSISRSECVYF